MPVSAAADSVARVVRGLRRRGLLVRVTTTVTPEAILRGVAAGRFPYPPKDGFRLVPWHLPKERMVLRAENVHVGKTLRRKLRRERWTTTVDEAFDEVLRRCADRPSTWISPQLQAAYRDLHRRGDAYSLEVWSSDGRLIGGTFGVRAGRIFTIESLFHTEDDASKAALVDAASRVRAVGGRGLDCEYPTGYIRALGAEVFDRSSYRRLLRAAQDGTPRLATERLPVARLVDPLSPDAVDTS